MKSNCKHPKGFRGGWRKKCEFKELPNKTLFGEPTAILTQKVPPEGLWHLSNVYTSASQPVPSVHVAVQEEKLIRRGWHS